MAITSAVIAEDTPTASVITTWLGNTQDERVVNGFLVEDDNALYVTISAGTAWVKDATGKLYQIISSAEESLLLTDDDTNYIYLHSDNGSDWLTNSTSSTVPDDAIHLATVVCASGDITSVTDARPIEKHEKVYSMLGKTMCVAGTYNNYIHLNPSGSKYVKIKKIKYTVRCNSTTPYIYCYYNLGSGETQADAYKDSGSYTETNKDLTLNVSSTDATADVYVRFYYSCGSSTKMNLTSIRIYTEEWS